MKKINLRESLIKMDIDTECKYDLTSLYESCRLDEKKKQELVKFVNDYDIDATNALLTNEASNQGLMEKVSDDLSDEELKEFNLDKEECNVEVLEESGDYQVVCKLKNDQDDICSEHDNLDDAIKAGKEELKSFDNVIVRNTKTGEETQLNESNNMNDDVSNEIHKAISGDRSAIQSLKKQGYKVRKLVNPLQSAEVGTFEIVDPTTGKTYNYDNSVNPSNEVVESLQAYPGDYVDFGAYGKLYICNDLGDRYWVTDEPEYAGNKNAPGWFIDKDLAKEIIDDEDLDESIIDKAISAIPAGLVSKALSEEKQLNESEQDRLIKDDVINWLQNHESAWSDITSYLNTEDIESIELDEILGWIADHDTLYSDFQRFFDITLDEDLDEGVLGDIGKVAKAAGKEIANKTGLTKAYNNSNLKTKVDNVKNKINNSDTMKTLKNTNTFKRIKDAKDVRSVQDNIKAARSPEEIEIVAQQIQALQKDGKLHTNGHMSYLTRQLNDRKKQLGIKDVKKESYEDDFDDDELANIHGGDRNYCPDCGSSNYHDGHCYNCGDPLEESTETKQDENIICKNSKGDYLVAANSGRGFTTYNKNDVCIGGIDSEDELEAKNKFLSGKLDECKSINEGHNDSEQYVIDMAHDDYESGHPVEDYKEFAKILHDDGIEATDSLWYIYQDNYYPEDESLEEAREGFNNYIGSEEVKASGRWAQVNLRTGEYCGNGGRSWVTKDSSHIDTWPSKEAAIEDGKTNYKKSFKYGKSWDVVNLNSEVSGDLVEESFNEDDIIDYDYDEEESQFTEIDSKQVTDIDGFSTDYTMYRNTETGEYVFIFGDKDIYSPEDTEFDWSCDTEKEAREWFDNYIGFDDEEDYYDEIYSGNANGIVIEEFDDSSFTHMFYYNCNNPTFGYDFEEFANTLGAKKVYGKEKGKRQNSWFYIVPSKEVYDKLKEVARKKYGVEMQKLLPYNGGEGNDADIL